MLGFFGEGSGKCPCGEVGRFIGLSEIPGATRDAFAARVSFCLAGRDLGRFRKRENFVNKKSSTFATRRVYGEEE